ncbi:hypothetical protein DW061_13155 [Ruminococcus sp. AF42-9BH]|nr:hypothetical protein DW061_13155 [Ruminococcus sp. AF42-9BH]
MYDFANFTVTVYANDSNVNIVSADNYESREFNQWKRAKYNFSFNVSTEKKTIKALCSAVLTATGTAITAMYGSKLRVIISIYSDSARTKLVSEYKMSTDSYPV